MNLWIIPVMAVGLIVAIGLAIVGYGLAIELGNTLGDL